MSKIIKQSPLATHESLQQFLLDIQNRRETHFAFAITRPLAFLSGPRLRNLLDLCLPMAQARAIQLWQARDGRWQVTVRLRYRAGVRIADAYLNGDTSGLTCEEQATLSRALAMVEAARQDVPYPYLLAHRLFDAARACAVYDNPAIGTAAYGQVISAVSALVGGRANCQGFSDAYYLLGTLAGLQVGYQAGFKDRAPHLKNTLLLDGCWESVDVTAGIFPIASRQPAP